MSEEAGVIPEPSLLQIVLTAIDRLQGVALHTPVFRSRHFDEIANCYAYLKAENLQRTGSIHFRGVFNRIKAQCETSKPSSIISGCSGNFGQAIALTAKLLGIPATLIVEKSESDHQISAMREYGAEVLLEDLGITGIQNRARTLASQNNSMLLLPNLDDLMVAGEATALLEMIHDIPDLDCLVLSRERNGLLDGPAAAVKAMHPEITIIGAETMHDTSSHLETKAPHVSQWILVSEEQMLETQKTILQRMKLLVEPEGCISAAALRFHSQIFRGKKVGILLTCGNASFDSLCRTLARPMSAFVAPQDNPGYAVKCYSCKGEFDALDTIWCNCVASERTLVCPLCLNCFCKAHKRYKDEFWNAAPQILWDRYAEERSNDWFVEPEMESSFTKRPLVLFVDEDRRIQKRAIRMIRELGYGAILGRNGEEGLLLAKKYLPDLVITDALMSRIDGREMVRRIKENPETSNIKVIIATALYTQARHRSEAFKLFHVDEYVSKPITFNELRTLLQKYVPLQ